MRIMNEQELKKKLEERILKHNELVNYFAKQVGEIYKGHDIDKLYDPNLYGYMYMMAPREFLSTAEKDALDRATLSHVTHNYHHPEAWAHPDDLLGFTRINYTPNGLIHVERMPIGTHIVEMCADWCATAKERENTPLEWFEQVNGHRWIFSLEQQDYIRATLKNMWFGEDDGKIDLDQKL